MGKKKISAFTAASALTGAEIVPVLQGGVNKKTTTQEIADLGAAGQIYIEKTHSQLLALKAGNTLIPGAKYAITDFKYVADQPDFNSDGTPKTSVVTKTGAVFETIVLTATSINTFANEAYSVQFPTDIIHYDIDFTATEVMESSAKGRITYREDADGNSADFDFRNALFKRYESSTGSGIFNQYKDNSEASVELPLFSNYGTAIIKKK